ncbi:MAG: hypothetical protein O3A00_01705 [Planctomycetota bacterium]|nr:hypothetical protein [Planctomycetota bacterium]
MLLPNDEVTLKGKSTSTLEAAGDFIAIGEGTTTLLTEIMLEQPRIPRADFASSDETNDESADKSQIISDGADSTDAAAEPIQGTEPSVVKIELKGAGEFDYAISGDYELQDKQTLVPDLEFRQFDTGLQDSTASTPFDEFGVAGKNDATIQTGNDDSYASSPSQLDALQKIGSLAITTDTSGSQAFSYIGHESLDMAGVSDDGQDSLVLGDESQTQFNTNDEFESSFNVQEEYGRDRSLKSTVIGRWGNTGGMDATIAGTSNSVWNHGAVFAGQGRVIETHIPVASATRSTYLDQGTINTVTENAADGTKTDSGKVELSGHEISNWNAASQPVTSVIDNTASPVTIDVNMNGSDTGIARNDYKVTHDLDLDSLTVNLKDRGESQQVVHSDDGFTFSQDVGDYSGGDGTQASLTIDDTLNVTDNTTWNVAAELTFDSPSDAEPSKTIIDEHTTSNVTVSGSEGVSLTVYARKPEDAAQLETKIEIAESVTFLHTQDDTLAALTTIESGTLQTDLQTTTDAGGAVIAIDSMRLRLSREQGDLGNNDGESLSIDVSDTNVNQQSYSEDAAASLLIMKATEDAETEISGTIAQDVSGTGKNTFTSHFTLAAQSLSTEFIFPEEKEDESPDPDESTGKAFETGSLAASFSDSAQNAALTESTLDIASTENNVDNTAYRTQSDTTLNTDGSSQSTVESLATFDGTYKSNDSFALLVTSQQGDVIAADGRKLTLDISNSSRLDGGYVGQANADLLVDRPESDSDATPVITGTTRFVSADSGTYTASDAFHLNYESRAGCSAQYLPGEPAPPTRVKASADEEFTFHIDSTDDYGEDYTSDMTADTSLSGSGSTTALLAAYVVDSHAKTTDETGFAYSSEKGTKLPEFDGESIRLNLAADSTVTSTDHSEQNADLLITKTNSSSSDSSDATTDDSPLVDSTDDDSNTMVTGTLESIHVGEVTHESSDTFGFLYHYRDGYGTPTIGGSGELTNIRFEIDDESEAENTLAYDLDSEISLEADSTTVTDNDNHFNFSGSFESESDFDFDFYMERGEVAVGDGWEVDFHTGDHSDDKTTYSFDTTEDLRITTLAPSESSEPTTDDSESGGSDDGETSGTESSGTISGDNEIKNGRTITKSEVTTESNHNSHDDFFIWFKDSSEDMSTNLQIDDSSTSESTDTLTDKRRHVTDDYADGTSIKSIHEESDTNFTSSDTRASNFSLVTQTGAMNLGNGTRTAISDASSFSFANESKSDRLADLEITRTKEGEDTKTGLVTESTNDFNSATQASSNSVINETRTSPGPGVESYFKDTTWSNSNSTSENTSDSKQQTRFNADGTEEVIAETRNTSNSGSISDASGYSTYWELREYGHLEIGSDGDSTSFSDSWSNSEAYSEGQFLTHPNAKQIPQRRGNTIQPGSQGLTSSWANADGSHPNTVSSSVKKDTSHRKHWWHHILPQGLFGEDGDWGKGNNFEVHEPENGWDLYEKDHQRLHSNDNPMGKKWEVEFEERLKTAKKANKARALSKKKILEIAEEMKVDYGLVDNQGKNLMGKPATVTYTDWDARNKAKAELNRKNTEYESALDKHGNVDHPEVKKAQGEVHTARKNVDKVLDEGPELKQATKNSKVYRNAGKYLRIGTLIPIVGTLGSGYSFASDVKEKGVVLGTVSNLPAIGDIVTVVELSAELHKLHRSSMKTVRENDITSLETRQARHEYLAHKFAMEHLRSAMKNVAEWEVYVDDPEAFKKMFNEKLKMLYMSLKRAYNRHAQDGGIRIDRRGDSLGGTRRGRETTDSKRLNESKNDAIKRYKQRLARSGFVNPPGDVRIDE